MFTWLDAAPQMVTTLYTIDCENKSLKNHFPVLNGG